MKIALCLVFLTVTNAAFVCASNGATTTSDARAQQNARASSQAADHGRVSQKNHPHSPANSPKPNHPRPLPKNQKHLGLGQPPAAQRSAARAITAPVLNKPAGTSRPVRLSPGPRNFASSPNTVRHHNPNPATLGGSKAPTAANTASVSGTRMSRRP